LFVLPESLSTERRTPFRWARANPAGSLRLLRSHHDLFAVSFVLCVLSGLAHEALPSTFVSTRATVMVGHKAVGLDAAAVGVCSAIDKRGWFVPSWRGSASGGPCSSAPAEPSAHCLRRRAHGTIF
jgi:DHA1 family tetracycline resistance protein-like MFS transporter